MAGATVIAVAGLTLLRIDLLAALSFPLLVAANNRGRLDRFLSATPWHVLGTLSDSLHLIHNGQQPGDHRGPGSPCHAVAT